MIDGVSAVYLLKSGGDVIQKLEITVDTRISVRLNLLCAVTLLESH